jgi:hypothetical protein
LVFNENYLRRSFKSASIKIAPIINMTMLIVRPVNISSLTHGKKFNPDAGGTQVSGLRKGGVRIARKGLKIQRVVPMTSLILLLGSVLYGFFIVILSQFIVVLASRGYSVCKVFERVAGFSILATLSICYS